MFTARYPGMCRDCDDPINVGDRVEFDDYRNLLHVVCPESSGGTEGFERVARPVCPHCFLIMPRYGLPCECRE